MRYLIFCISLFVTVSTASQLQAAESPASLQASFNRIPTLPDSIDAATGWVDGEGKITAPSLLQLSADLESQRKAVTQIAHANDETDRANAMKQVDSLGKGMANIGIDMQRLQTDPAYAQQMQARMQQMSPQELMALSQQMAQPMSNNGVPNQAQLMASETPAVKKAGDAGSAYTNGQVQRIQTLDAIWQKADAEIKQLQSQPLKVSAAKPRADWDDTGCTKACLAQWDVYTAQAVPLLEARANQILKIQRAAWQAHRQALVNDVSAADKHMRVTAFGSDAKSQYHRNHITGYDTAIVGDMEQFLGYISRSVEQAAYVKQCGKQMIRSPHAICIRNL